MRFRKIIEECGCLRYEGAENPEITMVSSDSRTVKRGSLFIAIEGYLDNGLRYIEDAVKRGAEAVVVEEKFRDMMKGYSALPIGYTSNARKCSLSIARSFYGRPSRGLKLIGVTGTNGKTTVTYLIEALLSSSGANPGVIGTISYRYNDRTIKAKNTTPDPISIQSLLKDMRESGVSHVIMEVSSHALAMDRVLPEDFDCAIFTNLSQDHLDFHHSMDAYFEAKKKLFLGLTPNASAIVNGDDEYGRRLLPEVKGKVITYGLHESVDYRGEYSSLSIGGIEFSINGVRFSTRLVGVHNLYNILSAYAFAKTYNIGYETISKVFSEIPSIPGRFERVASNRGHHVFVDYAHTPDALEHLLDAAQSLKEGRIITVFGCGGDRDKGKRPLMGRVAQEKSDIVIVTSDNPRTEDPLLIIEDIKQGLNSSNHLIIPDRRSAIYKAIELVQKGDIVFIAGKGHEDYQILGNRTVHFDDREVARAAMDAFGK